MTSLRRLAAINPPTPEFDRLADDSVVSFVPLEAVQSNGVDASRLRAKYEVARGYTRFREGDILIPKIAPTFQADRCVIARNLFGGVAAATTEVHVVRAGDRVDPRYLRYLFSSRPFLHGGEAEMTGVAGQKRVPDSWLRNLLVPITQLQDQRVVADLLDRETARINTLISFKRQLITLLDERWSASIAASVPPVLSGVDSRALRRAVESVVGGSWGGEQGESDVEALCIRGTDFDTQRMIADVSAAPKRSFHLGEFRSRSLAYGDLLIEKSGGSDTQPVGRVVQWTSDEAAVPTNFAARLRPTTGIDNRYLAYVFRSAYERGVTRAWIKQTTGIQNLDLGGLLSERWPMPSRRDQEQLAMDLDDLRARIHAVRDLLECQLALLATHRQALITAAVAGELDMPGAAA